MIKKMTSAGLFVAVLAAGWAVIFSRSPGQMFPEEMIWVFYLIAIPAIAQCGIFLEKQFWRASWKEGIPVSPILEKKWCDQYIVVRGICGQNRKLKGVSDFSGNSEYGSLYNLSSSGISAVAMSKTIKIGKVLIASAVLIFIIKMAASPIAKDAHLTLKGEIITSWPVVWFMAGILQLALFMCATLFLYWAFAKFACLVRSEK
jgi:hypothetical protein